MSSTAPPIRASQYKSADERAVTAAHKQIEMATVKALKSAGHRAPKKLARVVRSTTDVLDDLPVGELDVLLETTEFGRQLQGLVQDLIKGNKAKAGLKDKRLRAPLVLGEDLDIKPLTPSAAAAPLTSDVEVVGEDDPLYATYSTAEVADVLNINRRSALNWIKLGKLIGLEATKRGWRVPKAQIRRGRLAPGLDKVLDQFDDSEAAWHFLVNEQLIGEELVRPIDLLFKKDVERVVQLAKGFGQDYL